MTKKFFSLLGTFLLLSICLVGLQLVVVGYQYQAVLGDELVPSSTEDSSLLRESTTTTVENKVARLKLEPSSVELQPLGKRRFTAVLELDGERRQLDPRMVSWSVVRGGGRIDQYGEFQAWDASGEYPETILAKFNDVQARASVKVLAPPPNSSSEVKTTQTSPSPSANSQFIASPTPTPATRTTTQVSTQSPSPRPVLRDGDRTINTYSQTGSPLPSLKPSPQPSLQPTLRPSASPQASLTSERLQITQPQATEVTVRYDAQDLKSCLLNFFTQAEYTRYFDPAGEKASTGEVKDRLSAAERCFKTSKASTVTSQTEQCLLDRLGYSRYQQLATSQDTATRAELYESSGCFTQPEKISIQSAGNLDPYVESCLRVVLSDERVSDLNEGKKLSATEKVQARACFNYSDQGTQPPTVVSAAPETVSCLEQALGSDRFKALQNGEEPSSQELANAQECLGLAEITQHEILPVPIEVLPFIPNVTNSQDASVKTVSLQDRETKNTLTLSGTAVPNSVVDIYLFSDPIVVSTTADANGNWSYELYYHLPEGSHKAYTIVDHPEQGRVKSEVFTFDVAYAQTFDNDVVIPDLISVTPVSQNILQVYVGVALIIMSVAFMIILGIFQFTSPSEGTLERRGSVIVTPQLLVNKDGQKVSQK